MIETGALERILESVKKEVNRRIGEKPFESYEPPREKLSLSLAIQRAPGVPVIAEVKRASPSAGDLRAGLDPLIAAKQMVEGGAIAISVLTEKHHFKGDPVFLFDLAHTLRVPLLCKDFVVHPYQILEAAKLGADAILLIVKVLGPSLPEFLELARSLGLEVLVEVTNEEELEVAISSGAELIGINNRDLDTLEVDLTTTERLAPRVPREKLVVSESGISTPDDVRRVLHAGASALLVGTAIMRADNIKEKVRELVEVET